MGDIAFLLIVCVGGSAFALRRLVQHLRERRDLARGRCRCGYDITGLDPARLDVARCPECGGPLTPRATLVAGPRASPPAGPERSLP